MWACAKVHSRLARMYPEVHIAHMPSDAIQGAHAFPSPPPSPSPGGDGAPPVVPPPPPVDCDNFVGNAAVRGDEYAWHVDADPAGFPATGAWARAFGHYCNGEPGRPLLVSLLLYLNDAWPRDWDAETLFLDGDTDVGLLVRPRR